MEWPIPHGGREMKTDLEDLKTRVTGLESYKGKCEEDHRQHNQYRRETDNRMDCIIDVAKSTDSKVLKILDIMESYKPTVNRSSRAHITLDTLKEWGGWIVSMGGVIYIILDIRGII